MLIRPVALRDVPAMLAIYAPIVRETPISFELDVPSHEAFEQRVQKYAEGWAWIVAEVDGRIAGYAYGSPHRERLAYRWSTETSAYVDDGFRGRGVGKQLYEALFLLLADKGYCNAYAGIVLPNAASVALHASVGFQKIGCFPRVGRKFKRWHDVGWYHRALRDMPPNEE